MSIRFRRAFCALLIIVLAMGSMPAFAEKNDQKASIDALACDRDYGFSYKDKSASKNGAKYVLALIGDSIATKIVGGAVSWVMDQFVNEIFDDQEINVEKELRSINGKLDDIKKLLDDISEKLEIADYKGTIETRYKKYTEFKPEAVSRLNSLMDAETEQERKQIVRDWADRGMMDSSSGVMATTQWGNLITGRSADHTFIQCYDGYAKLAFAWEHDGYAFREATREADLALYIDACVLTGLYYNMVIAGEISGKSAKTEERNIQDFLRQIDEVLGYFNKPENQVVRDESKNRCQISGMTDFAVYVDKTYTGYVWSDGEGRNKDIRSLMADYFFVRNSRKYSITLRGERLKKLMEFYPGMAAGEILRDKIGVKGIGDDSALLVDREYRIDDLGNASSLNRNILVNAIPSAAKNFSAVGLTQLGVYSIPSLIGGMKFGRWQRRANTAFVVVSTQDGAISGPNVGDTQSVGGTILEASKSALRVETESGLDVVFDITNAVIEGKCEAGLGVDVIYHRLEDGSSVADRVWVNMPLTLLPEETASGVVTKHMGDTLYIKGDDGAKYEFLLSFNTLKLGAIQKGTCVTVTYQADENGNFYVLDSAKLEYSAPLFPFEALSMQVGATKKLKGLTKVPGAWTTENETVAKIGKDQKLKAVSNGQTNLLFTVGDYAKSISYKGVTVCSGDTVVIPINVYKKGSQIKSLTIKPKKLSVAVGETLQLNVTWKPQTATDTLLAFATSDESVAVVDESGLVTGVTPGKSTITVTAPSGVKKTRVVNVK